MSNSYPDLNFEVIKKAGDSKDANSNDLRLVIISPFPLSVNFKLTKSSGKNVEDFRRAHIVPLMYKLLTSSRGSDNLSFGFDRDHRRRQEELTTNKIIAAKFQVR